MKHSLSAFVAFFAAFAAYFYSGYQSIQTLAPTYDEPFHLAAGYIILQEHDFDYQGLWHPPLAEIAAAAPLFLMPKGERPTLETSQTRLQQKENYIVADSFLYENTVEADRMIHAGRAAHWLLFLPVLIVAVWTCAKRISPACAPWALLLLLVEPNLLAHGTLITTDFSVAAFGLAAFSAAAWYIEKQTTTRASLLGLCCALGWLCKYTAAVLYLPLIIWFALEQKKLLRHVYWRRHLAAALGFFLLPFAIVYRSAGPLIFIKGFANTFVSALHGRENFFLGEHSTDGWWLYFPASIVFKTPVTLLAAAAIGTVLALRLWRISRDRALLFLFVVPLFLVVVASQSRIQAGLRYILPVFPFIAVIGGYGLSRIADSIRGATFVCVLSLGAAAASVYRCSPWFLSYYNTLTPGPRSGHRYFTDSNTDWGQGLKVLADFVNGLNVSSIYLSYFGVADLRYYGIDYVPVAFASEVPRTAGSAANPAQERRILLAVSATNYQHTFGADKAIWDFLRPIEPTAELAYSIFLYDLTDNQAALRSLASLLERDGQPDQAQRLRDRIAARFAGNEGELPGDS